MLDILMQLCKDIFFFAAYINNGNSFPEPLTPEQEKECLARYAKGDEEARSMLIEHNLRLVAHIAKKFTGTNRDSDDVISIGTIGLIKAVSTYDAQKGTALATYAARCIENAILSLRTLFQRMSKITLLTNLNGVLFLVSGRACILWHVQGIKHHTRPSISIAFNSCSLIS